MTETPTPPEPDDLADTPAATRDPLRWPDAVIAVAAVVVALAALLLTADHLAADQATPPDVTAAERAAAAETTTTTTATTTTATTATTAPTDATERAAAALLAEILKGFTPCEILDMAARHDVTDSAVAEYAAEVVMTQLAEIAEAHEFDAAAVLGLDSDALRVRFLAEIDATQC